MTRKMTDELLGIVVSSWHSLVLSVPKLCQNAESPVGEDRGFRLKR